MLNLPLLGQGLGLDMNKCGIRRLGAHLMNTQSPIVRESLTALLTSTEEGIKIMTAELAEFDCQEHDPDRDTEMIDNILEFAQNEFKGFDTANQKHHREEWNIAALTKDRYEEFHKEVKCSTIRGFRASQQLHNVPV